MDADAVERVIFALVAQRALEPGSKLAATGWVAERVAIEGLADLGDDQAYRSMDFLLEALPEIASEVFASVAHLLNLDLDIVFVDTTSTYFEVDGVEELPEIADTAADDEVTNPVESGRRAFGHSKDFRTDLLTELREVPAQRGDRIGGGAPMVHPYDRERRLSKVSRVPGGAADGVAGGDQRPVGALSAP